MNIYILNFLVLFIIILYFSKIKNKKTIKLENNSIEIENWYDSKTCAYASTWDDSHIR